MPLRNGFDSTVKLSKYARNEFFCYISITADPASVGSIVTLLL